MQTCLSSPPIDTHGRRAHLDMVYQIQIDSEEWGGVQMCGLIGDSRRRRSVKDMRRRAENGDAPRGSHYDVTILELANDHYDNEVHVLKHSYIGQNAAMMKLR